MAYKIQVKIGGLRAREDQEEEEGGRKRGKWRRAEKGGGRGPAGREGGGECWTGRGIGGNNTSAL